MSSEKKSPKDNTIGINFELRKWLAENAAANKRISAFSIIDKYLVEIKKAIDDGYKYKDIIDYLNNNILNQYNLSIKEASLRSYITRCANRQNKTINKKPKQSKTSSDKNKVQTNKNIQNNKDSRFTDLKKEQEEIFGNSKTSDYI